MLSVQQCALSNVHLQTLTRQLALVMRWIFDGDRMGVGGANYTSRPLGNRAAPQPVAFRPAERPYSRPCRAHHTGSPPTKTKLSLTC